ncbi:MAG: CDP-diacylglycerol--glycerol-3-phosphate 3-phosphatidyltransferase [Alphaproteobacteria bacterium]
MPLNLPNILTWSRLFAVPVVMVALFLPGSSASWTALTVFILAALTDYLDGHLARSRGQLSPFGTFLDPVADKILVASVILALVALDRIDGWTLIAAFVITLREIVISGLREFLAGARRALPVSRLAKWKTAVQMVALGLLILGGHGDPLPNTQWLGEASLWLAAILSVITGLDYFRAHLGDVLNGPAAHPTKQDTAAE